MDYAPKMAFFAQNWRPPLNRSAGAPVEKVPYFRLGSGRGARGLPIAPKPEARGVSES